MTFRYAEPLVAVVLLVLCGFAWHATGTMRSGADVFPRLIIVALAILSAIYLVRSLAAGSAMDAVFIHKERFAIVLVLTLVYVSLFSYVGYFTTTAVFVPLMSYAIGFRRPVYVAITTAVFLATIYILFVFVFRRAVPPERILWLFP